MSFGLVIVAGGNGGGGGREEGIKTGELFGNDNLLAWKLFIARRMEDWFGIWRRAEKIRDNARATPFSKSKSSTGIFVRPKLTDWLELLRRSPIESICDEYQF